MRLAIYINKRSTDREICEEKHDEKWRKVCNGGGVVRWREKGREEGRV